MEERLTVVDAYRQYFLCLADVEMNAAEAAKRALIR
jgi:hypothetical protein